MNVYQEKALVKATAASAGVTAVGWLATEMVFGFWGLVVAIPVTLGATAWLAHKAKKIGQPWS